MSSIDLDVIWLTLRLAATVTLILLLVSIPLAWWLSQTRCRAKSLVGALLTLPMVGELDKAHAAEHSLEVHLPFLQAMLGDFQLVPLVAGETPRDVVAAVLDAVWGGPETLILVSSDLSHYNPYAIGCYALGAVEVAIGREELEQF